MNDKGNEGCLKLAMAQFSRDRFNGDENRERALELLYGIEGADVACLPEVWMGGVILDEEELEGLLDDIGSIAEEKSMWIITGGLFILENGEMKDVCHVIDDKGGVAGRQYKIFPSGAVGERQHCRGGSELGLFEIKGIKTGMLICVDMFYPELARAMTLDGAEVILNPSNIPRARIEMWHSLVRTRAAENTVFAVFLNNTDTEYADGREVMGESLAAGPDGLNAALLDIREQVHIIDIDISKIYRQRERWPYVEDIRNMGPITDSVLDGHRLTPTVVTRDPEPD